MAELLVTGGRVVDQSMGLDGAYDLAIAGGKVVAIGRDLPFEPGTRVVRAEGQLVVAGCIDAHTHLRDPGFTHRETLASGTRAAAMGGFTSIIAMCNTDPPLDRPERLAAVSERVRNDGCVNVSFVGAITRDKAGREVSDLEGLKQAGAVALGDDAYIQDSEVMWRVLKQARGLDLPVCVHCEDSYLIAGARMNEGITSRMLGLRGRPNASEAIAIARDVTLAALAGVHLHVLHITTAEGVEIVRQAKAAGVRVTTEVTPHHFTLTDEAVARLGPNAIISPPLRTERDVEAIKRGLRDGTIDLIATDHAPHAAEEKQNVTEANPGLTGLETAIAQVLNELVNPGVLELAEAFSKMTNAPAQLFGLKGKGTLRPGSDADLTIIDPSLSWRVDAEAMESKSKNSPYLGALFEGAPVTTIVGGEVVMDGRRLASQA